MECHRELRENIQNELGKFLSAQEARTTAANIYDVALDMDEEIGRILKDPLVRRLYDYDGQFFTARGTRLFHTAFDGLHLLKWLKDSKLETFFRGKEKHRAIQWLLDELTRHAWVARIRRMNWEEFRTLGMLPPAVLDAILQNPRHMPGAEVGPPRLSPEEQAFFQSFEKQMERKG
jgi:hypothetical protein